MPDNPAPYLTDWFLEIGPVVGDGPIGWQDLASWSQLMGVGLTPWEARTIRRLSVRFIAQRHEAKKSGCPEPLVEAQQERQRDRVNDQFANMMRALAARTD